MDRNTVIGFILLAVLLFFYLFLSTKSSQELQSQKQHELDSIAFIQRIQDSIAASKQASAALTDTAGIVKAPLKEELLVVENEVLRINFTNKGGQPAKVELKKYKSSDDKPVTLAGTAFDKISYTLNTGQGQAAEAGELFFHPGKVKTNMPITVHKQ